MSKLVYSEYQKAIFEDVRDGLGHTIVEARAGSGKCLGKGTPVLCFDGSIKNVEDVKPGDLIMGPDSKPRTVLSTSSGIGNLLKIIPVKGDPWVCNDAHILTLKGTNHNKDKIVDRNILDHIELYKDNKSLDKSWKLFRVGVSFQEQNVPFDPYLIGLWIGDGTKSEPSITSGDNEIINYCYNIAPKYNLEVVCKKEKSNCFKVRFRTADRKNNDPVNNPHYLRRYLKSRCIKNNEKNIPKEYLINSRDIRLKLLAGIIDTDGFNDGRTCCQIISSVKHLAEQYVFLARSLGFASYIHKKKTAYKSAKYDYAGEAWSVSISGNLNEIPCLLPRKKFAVRHQIKDHLKTGFSIENIGKGQYFGFTLDGDGRFLLGDFTVTHNTSTLLESLKYIPSDKKILVVAFNKKIAVELQERAPSYSNLDICTLHSFGYRLIRKSLGKVKLDTEKTFKIIKSLLEPFKKTAKEKDNYETIFEMRRCVSLCKGLITDTPAKIDELMDEFDVSTGSMSREDFIHTVIIALGECKKKKDTVDYDDMIYLPFVLNLPVEKYDRVLIDEVQDLTPAQIYLALSACKKNGRILACGDNFQVLYKFRGADLDAINNLKERLKAKILPLPISYRCGKNIIFHAQKMVPDITYAPNAKDGKISYISEADLYNIVKPGDFIVSRTNAPLIKICFGLWRKKIPANLKGKDLGPALTGLVKQSKKKTIKSFLVWLDLWSKDEINRLRSKNRDTRMIVDKVECLTVLCEGLETVNELIETIKSLFENKTTDNIVSLYTIHGAKGLEAKRVFFLSYTMTFGQSKEEINAKYVAVTRAKEDLFLVNKI